MYYDDSSYLINLLFWSCLAGLIPAVIAKNKGYNFLGWWIFGAVLFIIALPGALLAKPNVQEIDGSAVPVGGRKCPHCSEIIKREAKGCRFCGRDVEPLPDPNDFSVLEKHIDSIELNKSDEHYHKQGPGFIGFF